MLPDNMFLNLIDTNLQEKIAMSNDLDGNAVEALKLLLEQGATTMTVGLNDWTIETQNGQNILFYEGKNYIPENTDLRLVLQGLVHRTGMGPRTGPDCNRFKQTNGPGPPNFLRKTGKDCSPKTGSGPVQD